MALSVSWIVSEQRQEIIGQQRIDDRSADVLTQGEQGEQGPGWVGQVRRFDPTPAGLVSIRIWFKTDKDCLSRCSDSHCKDKTVMRPSYLSLEFLNG